MIKGIFFAAGGLYRHSGPTEAFALNLLKTSGFPTAPSALELVRQQILRAQASVGVLSHTAYWDRFLLMRGVTDPAQ